MAVAESSTEILREHPIIFFDGVCNLCNHSIDFVLRADKARVFRIASLQGDTARKLLAPQSGEPEEWSMVLLDGDGMHERSGAALRVLKRLGGLRGFLGSIGLCFPGFLRDFVYRLVARYRYRLFGRRETCRIPTDAESAVFLP
jgi:predicted DCC family thiol-disulfide oxidoreductase YuxK